MYFLHLTICRAQFQQKRNHSERQLHPLGASLSRLGNPVWSSLCFWARPSITSTRVRCQVAKKSSGLASNHKSSHQPQSILTASCEVSWQIRLPVLGTWATHKTSAVRGKLYSGSTKVPSTELLSIPPHPTSWARIALQNPALPQFFSLCPNRSLRCKPPGENQPYLASTRIPWCRSCTSFRGVKLNLHHLERKETIQLFSSSIPFPST